jgi:hypothetical protein
MRRIRSRIPSWPVIAAAVIVVLVVVSVMRFPGPNHTLETNYTDHLQHEYSSWAFLHIGFRIFALPKADWGPVHARYVHLLWDSVPTIYPLGLVLFFMPFGVASNEGWLSDAHVIALMVMVLGTAGALASFQLHRTLRLSYEPVLAAILTVLGSILFVTWGLNGFIDPLAAGLALLGIWWVQRERPGLGLGALTLALWLQYRLWYLWPLVIALAIQRRREIRWWQLSSTIAIGFVSAFTFGLSLHAEGNFHEIPGIGPNALAVTHGVSGVQLVGLAAGALVVGITYHYDSFVAAACVTLALALIFFVDQWEPWYPVLLVPLLAIVRRRPAQLAVCLMFVQAVVYLGGFPNVFHTAQLYITAVR